MKVEIEDVVRIAEAAGRRILEVYAAGAGAARVTAKQDESPLTLADQRSHDAIVAALRALTPDVPIISEEGEPAEYARLGTARRWIVDPLDGTKEFIKRTGEFTVNIALVEGTRPVLGVVHAPALGTTWLGEGTTAQKWEGAARTTIRVTSAATADALRVVTSRDHAGPAVKALLERLPGARTLSMGSSLKFCLIAEGKADLYLRDGPTMEWDTAAAHAVLVAAGGEVHTLDGGVLGYGKEDLRNPHFVAVGDRAFDWSLLLAVRA